MTVTALAVDLLAITLMRLHTIVLRCTARFWTRNRPGDGMTDKFNASQLVGEEKDGAMQTLAELGR